MAPTTEDLCSRINTALTLSTNDDNSSASSAGTNDWEDASDEDPEKLIIDDSAFEDYSPLEQPSEYLRQARERLLKSDLGLRERFQYPRQPIPGMNKATAPSPDTSDGESNSTEVAKSSRESPT